MASKAFQRTYTQLQAITKATVSLNAEGVSNDELATVGGRLAQVVKTKGGTITLQVFSGTEGVPTNAEVSFLGAPPTLKVSDQLSGRFFNAYGDPIDGGPQIEGEIRPFIDVREAAGKITEAGSSITIANGKDMKGALAVATPYGWKAVKTVVGDDLVVTFVMNEAELTPVIGHPDKAVTPFTVEGEYVRIWIENAAEGFTYQIVGSTSLDNFRVLTNEYVEPNYEFGVGPTKPLLLQWKKDDSATFFSIRVSDKSDTVGTLVEKPTPAPVPDPVDPTIIH